MTEVHHFPPELSSFVGRVEELAAIEGALAAGAPVVTLVGPGGVGKSRLAATAGRQQVSRWRDGVWWVDLSRETDNDRVGQGVAAAVGVLAPPGDGVIPALLSVLDSREVLIVLDNCEHLAPGVAQVAAAIGARVPDVGILATSRAPIGVPGERVVRVPPLALADALALFMTRAEGNGLVIAEHARARRVCDRLDRLPLALELAAAWAGTLTLDEIADSLGHPFSLLDGGPRTVPYRQQSLNESMRWSYDLLDGDEQRLFRLLAPFEPGFTAETALQVAAAFDLPAERGLKALRGLVNASLVVADATGTEARFSMLGVVRAYASDRLAESGEWDLVHDRHLSAFLAAVEALEPLLETDKDTWRQRVGPDYANIRTAIERGLDRPDPEPARRLAAGIAWLWHLESRGPEGLRLLGRAAERGGGEQSPLQARLLVAQTLVADTAGAGQRGYEPAAAALEMAVSVGDAPTARLARSLAAVGAIAESLGAAVDGATQARDEALAAGDEFVAEASEVLLGIVHALRDDNKTAVKHLEPAVGGLVRRGDRGVAATALAQLALASARTGDLVSAARWAEEAVVVAEPLHDFHRFGSAVSTLAEVLGLQGRLDEAVAALARIEKLVAASGAGRFIPGWERTMAQIELWRGNPEQAIRWCRRERAWWADSSGSTDDEALAPDTQIVLAAAVREADEADAALGVLDLAERSADQFELPRVRAGVLEQRAHLIAKREPETALAHHHEALRLRAEHGLVLGCIDSLEAIACLLAHREKPEVACVLLGAVDRARSETGYAAGGLTPERCRELADTLPRAEADETVARGRAMDLREAVALAARMRGPRGRPDTGWESLTPTERSVVELAVEGLSNPAIATKLYMSRGTVKTHLAHVYRKLQVANRTELARLAGSTHD